MENEKLQITLGAGMTKGEVIIREGSAEKLLDPKAPVKTSLSGVIHTPYDYLAKRVSTGQFEQSRAYIEVNREEITLKLIINENDEYTRGDISGQLEYYPKFIQFGINTGKKWVPSDLGMFFKMNRAFFSENKVNMELVTTLMNYKATINNKVEQSIKDNGSHTDNFSQVVNSNLPKSFKLKIPIFKGMNAEDLEIETFAFIDGRDVSLTLLSPGANQTLEDIRNKVIDEQITLIRDIAPDIVIIEI